MLHGLILVMLLVGLPIFNSPLDVSPQTVVVEVVNVADITNLPSVAKKPAAEKPVDVKTEKPAELPAPKKAAPKETVPDVPPPPAKKPEITPEPKKEEEPKKQIKKDKPKEKAPLLDKTEREEDDFLSVLKTVDELAKTTETKEPDNQSEALDTAPGVSERVFRNSQPLSMSQIDAIRKQIEKCWNMPAGARYAEDLVVEVGVTLNRDGSVRDARALASGGQMDDPFYRAAAESAVRAILNPACSTFNLPEDKYDEWREMILRFDPRDMLVY